MNTRSKAREAAAAVTNDENSKENSDKSKSSKMSDKDKLQQLHDLLVKMTEQFDSKLSEISKSFDEKIDSAKEEINSSVDKKIEKVSGHYQQKSSVLPSQETDNEVRASTSSQSKPEESASTLKSDMQSIYIRSDHLEDLPIFDGKTTDWPVFIKQFHRSTKAYHYDDVQNNRRLSKALIGPARDLVEPLLIHPENVSQILSDLEERFGSQELLVEEQISNVRNFPSIQESELYMIIDLADKVRNCKNFLLSCDCGSYLDNPLLVKEIRKKLPLSKQLEWAKIESTLPVKSHFQEMSKWLSETAQYLHRINPHRQPIINKPQENSVVKPRLTCDLCQGVHNLEGCQMFKEMTPEKRFEYATSSRICFSCLKKGHPTRFCKTRRKCEVADCVHKHHSLLHTTSSDISFENNPPFESGRIMQLKGSQEKRQVLFQMLPIKVFGPKGFVETFAMFDSAADISIMDRNLANEIGVDGPEQNLSIKWLDEGLRKFTCKVADVNISGTFTNAPVFTLQNVRIMDKINLPSQSLSMEDLTSRYNYLKDIPMNSYENAVPQMLLSLRDFRLTLSNKSIISNDIGPIATETKLGWMIYGATHLNTEESHKRVCMTYEFDDEEDLEALNSKVQKFINSEDFGCSEDRDLLTDETQRAYYLMDKTTNKLENGYESGLLWKQEGIKLPNNFSNAVKRFESIEKKMEKDLLYRSVYESKIEEYVQKKYAVELTEKEASEYHPRTWYLPHFGVLNKNKPGKFRLVFDAAAKFMGTSLNSNLLSGPDLNKPLMDILFKFREKRVGVCGDIKEMFHQVRIKDEDQNSQRFVFRKLGTKKLSIFKMQVMTFGATCSPTMAQYIKNINAQQFQSQYPEAADIIQQSHYVDDYVCSFQSDSEAINITQQVIQIHAKGGFLLRGFLSNSVEVMDVLNKYQSTKEEVSMDVGTENTKILGLQWNLKDDQFFFKAHLERIDDQIKNFSKAPTKRSVLSIVMSLFDPFGFIANFTIFGKLILQSIWRQKIGWDQDISGDTFNFWKQWLTELPNIENFKLSRCHAGNIFESKVQLHIFVDASSQAFAAVAYFRIINKDKSTTTSLVCSKAKCAPLKLLSIPRLELQAAVLGTRLMNYILKNQSFKIDKIFLWSDSTTVLHWIKNEKREYKQYVANRIYEIRESTAPSDWYKVPTKENPADQATRLSNPRGMIGNKLWMQGPEWLLDGNWPTQTLHTPNPESEIEIRDKNSIYTIQVSTYQPVINYKRFSNFMRLVRAMAWIRRFIDNCRNKNRKNKTTLSSSEVNESELLICKLVQQEVFSTEYESLKNSMPLNKTSKIYNHNPIVDENGIIRVSGRIDNAPTIPLYTKRPVIMPKEHYVTEILVRYFHCKCKHLFQELTICEIRMKFWINDLRSVLSRIKSRCARCKILEAKLKSPLMGPHPEDRLTPFIRPFTFTGVDYFGPVNVTIGRTKQKRWIAVFTCLTIRAVHTEVAEDLSSDSCIMCIRNFINLRGAPKRMRSDNGSNFVGINNELMTADDIFEKEQVQDELAIKNIEWKFNVPSNPSAGGCWERMVGMIKRILKQSLKEVAPRVETLRSFLLEASNIINSRPLTHVPTNSLEEDPLTPNDFLLGDANRVQSFRQVNDTDDKIWTLQKQWKIANHLKNHFWRRFISEYIPTLNRRSKNHQNIPQLKIGDLVLIGDDNMSRNVWPRGIVLETFSGTDGIIRSALVKSRGKTIKRPTCKLAVIGNVDDGNNF